MVGVCRQVGITEQRFNFSRTHTVNKLYRIPFIHLYIWRPISKLFEKDRNPGDASGKCYQSTTLSTS